MTYPLLGLGCVECCTQRRQRSATGSCSRVLLQLLAPAAEEPPPPMLQRSTKKEVRLRSLKFKGGNFEAPRPEEEDTLRAELTPLASPALRLVYCLNTVVP